MDRAARICSWLAAGLCTATVGVAQDKPAERPVLISITLSPVGRGSGSGGAYRGIGSGRGGRFAAHYRFPATNIELGLVVDGAGLSVTGTNEDLSDVGVFVEARSVHRMHSPKLSWVGAARIGMAGQTLGTGALSSSRGGFAFGALFGLRFALSNHFALEGDVSDRLAFFGGWEGTGERASGSLNVLQLGVVYLVRRQQP